MGNMLPTITVAQMVSHVCGQAHAVSRGVCRPPRLRRPVMSSALASVTPVLVPWHSHVLKVAVGKLPQLATKGGKSVAPSYRSFCHSFSQQLLVVLHTAWRIRSVATTAMPSPAAKLKAARRLPKRLRISGEAPQGDIARMREEATARYERGESSSRTLHSCLQKPREGRADDYSDWRAAGTWSWYDDWNTPWYGATDWQQSAQATDSTASEPSAATSSWYWAPQQKLEASQTVSQGRPLPPTPPPSRHQRLPQKWRAKEAGMNTAAKGKPQYDTSPRLGMDRPSPQSSRHRKRGQADPATAAHETMADNGAQEVQDSAAAQEEAVKQQTGEQSSAPGGDSEELSLDSAASANTASKTSAQHGANCVQVRAAVCEVSAGSYMGTQPSAPLVSVSVDSDQDMGADQMDTRCLVRSSDSEELVPAYSSKDVKRQSGEGNAPSSSRPSRTSSGATDTLRPWTKQDKDLSKALSGVLRHRSNLHRDRAGYAKLADVLVHPLIRRHRPTIEWIAYIVKDAKQRFSLDETGTHIRAVQGHSIHVDSSQLLRQLEKGDIGDMVPTRALHSTYFSCIPSIMQHGLLPGGTRGTSYRRHIHLAMNDRPTAGLRAGSEVILEIDLMRAHNAGCVFYISDNNVILTEDCVPPPCIARAKRTSTGEAYDLGRFRTAYKLVCAASAWREIVTAGLGNFTAWSVPPARPALSPGCRFQSGSASGKPSTSGREDSRLAMLSPSPASPRLLPWPPRPLGQLLGLPAAYRKHLTIAVHLPRSFFRLREAMQRGTPVGKERRYSWKLPHLRRRTLRHTLGAAKCTLILSRMTSVALA